MVQGLFRAKWCVSYVRGRGQDLGQDDPGQAVPTVVQRGHGQLQQVVLVLQGAEVQQTGTEPERGLH